LCDDSFPHTSENIEFDMNELTNSSMEGDLCVACYPAAGSAFFARFAFAPTVTLPQRLPYEPSRLELACPAMRRSQNRPQGLHGP